MGRTKGSTGKGSGRPPKKSEEDLKIKKFGRGKTSKKTTEETVIVKKIKTSRDDTKFSDLSYEPEPPYWPRPTTNFFSSEWGISKPWEKPEDLPTDDPAPILRCLARDDSDSEPDDLINIDLESEDKALDFHYEFFEFPEFSGEAYGGGVAPDFKELLKKPFFTVSDRVWFYSNSTKHG